MHARYAAIIIFLTSTAAAVSALPHLAIPSCPALAIASFNTTVPTPGSFPPTAISVCWTPSHLALNFTAANETNFYYNASQHTNGALYEYEVMEMFLWPGTAAPETYFEYEVSPNPAGVTYQAFVYNPSRVRAKGTPFAHFFVDQPESLGFTVDTIINKAARKWHSRINIPLGLFNPPADPRGSRWRINFFRTITNPSMFPNQVLGSWSPVNESNFHMTPFLGYATFV